MKIIIVTQTSSHCLVTVHVSVGVYVVVQL